jgi:hypothetical protein
MKGERIDRWLLLVILAAILILIALALIVTPADAFTSPFESPLETPTPMPTAFWVPDGGNGEPPGLPAPASAAIAGITGVPAYKAPENSYLGMAIMMGVTVYEAPPGKALACRGHAYDLDREWIAVPTEWILGGYLNCGDRIYTCLPNGYCLDGVPVRDTGCLLHYPVHGTDIPFGVDVPMHMREGYGFFHTGLVPVRFYRSETDDWWYPEPVHLTAWDTKHCNGPLTLREWPGKHGLD